MAARFVTDLHKLRRNTFPNKLHLRYHLVQAPTVVSIYLKIHGIVPSYGVDSPSVWQTNGCSCGLAVKIEKLGRATRGKKRKSSVIENTGIDNRREQNEDDTIEVTAPAPKRGTTETRRRSAQQTNGPEIPS